MGGGLAELLRHINELLAQHHNCYLNNCWRLLTKEAVDVYAVKTDAFTVKPWQLEEVRELLN